MRLALALLAVACGSREAAPVDYGPPAPPIDPIVCPADTLVRFAAPIAGATIQIATVPMVDTSRVDKVPCKPSESDDACLARARARPVPSSYEVTGIQIGGDITHVEFEYDLDGKRYSERADTMVKMVARIKALQAQGHAVTLIRGESAPDAGSRHAAIAYRGIGVRERRVATLRIRTDDVDRAIADVQARAVADRIELRDMHVDDPGNLVILATCQ